MHNYTIAELVKGLQSKQFSSVELTQHFLARISQFNDQYNAVITVTGRPSSASSAVSGPKTGSGFCTRIVWCTSTAQRYLLH